MTSPLKSPELRERVVALRRAGKSLREIKDISGVRRNEILAEMLRGVPPQPWTRRPRAKDDQREKARELRARGYTYNEIADELDVSKSSVSLWVRDMPRPGRLSSTEIRQRNSESIAAYWARERPRREALRKAIRDNAFTEVGPLTDREIVIAGAIAYWCEGSKNKGPRRSDRVVFINSDPQLIRFFLRFLDVIGVSPDRLVCRLQIHESADVAAAEQFWMDVTGLPADQFRRPTLKRHNPKTLRTNTGANYHGCLKIDVRASLELYRQIEGWAAAAMSAGQPAA
jgi:transposase